MTYEQIKAELSRRRNRITHFTRKFYQEFCAAQRAAKHTAENGIDLHYWKDGVYLNHAYDPVYESNFYRKNGGAYCEFLSIIS